MQPLFLFSVTILLAFDFNFNDLYDDFPWEPIDWWPPDPKRCSVIFWLKKGFGEFFDSKKIPSIINVLAWGYFQLSFSFLTIQNTLKNQAFYVICSPKNQNFIKYKMSPFWVLIHRFNPRIHILFAAFIDLYSRHFLHLFNFISSKSNGITLKRPPSMGLNKKNTKIHRDEQFPSQSDSIHKI